MPTLEELLVQRQLEGEKLRQGTIAAGEEILPVAAGVEKANLEGLAGSNLRNAQTGSDLQNIQQQLAQRFLQGGLSAPLDPGARETLESGRTEALKDIRGTAGGNSGLRRSLEGQLAGQHVQARSGLVNSANDRLFRQLSTNLNPGLSQIPTPILSGAVQTATGGQAGVQTAGELEQRMLQRAAEQQQRDDDELFKAISEIGKVLPTILDILF